MMMTSNVETQTDVRAAQYLAKPVGAPRWKASTPPEGIAAAGAATAALEAWGQHFAGEAVPAWLGGMVGAVAKRAVRRGGISPEGAVVAALGLPELVRAGAGWWGEALPEQREVPEGQGRALVTLLFELAVDGGDAVEAAEGVRGLALTHGRSLGVVDEVVVEDVVGRPVLRVLRGESVGTEAGSWGPRAGGHLRSVR